MNNVHVTADEETDPLKKLETLVSTLKLHYYHTDQWTLDEANLTLTRTHTRTRRSLFTPHTPTSPVPLDRLIGRRVAFVDYGQGKTDKLVDNNFKDMENQTGDWMTSGKLNLDHKLRESMENNILEEKRKLRSPDQLKRLKRTKRC